MGDEQEPKVVWLLQRFQQVQDIGLNWDIQSRGAFIGHQSFGLAASAWRVAQNKKPRFPRRWCTG